MNGRKGPGSEKNKASKSTVGTQGKAGMDTGKTAETDLAKFYELLPKVQTQLEASEESSLFKLKNHIVVCGIHSSIMHFILPLRAKYLERQQQDIVIITPMQQLPSDIWDSISRFPRIYMVIGSPLLLEVLRKA